MAHTVTRGTVVAYSDSASALPQKSVAPDTTIKGVYDEQQQQPLPEHGVIEAPSASAVRDKHALPADASAADIFAQALIDDSNHELDWLWAASQLTDVIQRRYCLERALAINNTANWLAASFKRLRPGRNVKESEQHMKRFPQLHMIDTGFSTRSVDVTGAMTIGRDTANDIVLAEATISRCHALLLMRAGHMAVMDLESANGTFVNGIQVRPDAPVHLADGDMIRMGRVIAHYSAPSEVV